MKKTLIVTLVSLSLNSILGYAEEVTESSTKVVIPVVTNSITVDTSSMTSNVSNIKASNQTEPNSGKAPVVLDKQQKEQPVINSKNLLLKNDSFYRVEQSQRGTLFVIQDFYITGEKRTDPYSITDKSKVKATHFTNLDYEEMGVSGLFISWFKKGQIEQKGVFDQGMRKGLWVMWYENGQKKSSGRYKQGLKDGQWTTWYQNGKRMQKGTYREGKKEGVWIFWYGNGKKREAGRYSDDEKVERWSYWDKTGKMLKDDVVEDAIND